MDSRKTLFLLVLAGLVGGVVVWDHFKGVSTTDRAARSKRILAIDAKAITHVELIRSNQTISLEKNADNWNIKQPLAVRADYGAVSSILDELEFAERSRTLTEKDLSGVNLAEFGLAPPRTTIKLQSKTGATVLHIGGETPAQDALYVQVDGEKSVYVVRQPGFARASQTLEQLRSRTVLEFVPAATTRLELKAADRTIELSKSTLTNSGPVWVVTHPLAVRADQTKISELLAELEHLRVADFISEKPEDLHAYRLDEPDREISVYSGRAGQTLQIGRPLTNDASKVYAKVKGTDSIFTIPAAATKRFSAQINELRDSRIFAFQPADVTQIEIARGADKISAHRSNAAWQITGPVQVAGDDAAIQEFLAALAGLRAQQFVADVATDLEKYGLAAPGLTVALPGVADLLFGAVDATNDVRYVKRTDEPFIYGVAAASADIVPAHYRALRSRRIFALRPEQITKLAVGDVELARGEDGKWTLIAPAQGVLDVDAVNALTGLLAGLRAESFGRPRIELDQTLGTTIRATVGATTHWLAFAPGGEAAASNVELTFTLAAPVVGTLAKKLVSEPGQ